MQCVLQKVATSAGLQRAKRLRIAGIGSQHDDARVRKLASDRADRVEPAHLGHLQIHERDVRTVRPELLNRFTSGRRFRHERHVRLCREQPGDALAHDGVIVDAENSDALGIVAHESLVSLNPKTF